MIVSFGFPPLGGPSVQRPLKFCKYLKQFGWEPIVITANWSLLETDQRDNDLMYERKNLDIPIYEVKDRIRPYSPSLSMSKTFQKNNNQSIYRKIIRSFAIPDSLLTWCPFVIQTAGQIVHEYKPIQAIIATSPPASSLLCGYLISKRYNIPWIADLRDSWTTAPNFGKGRYGFYEKGNRYLEKRILNSASHIIAATDGIKHGLMSSCDNRQCTVINNGYDEEDFSNIPPITKEPNKLQFVYAGSFSGTQTPEYFLKALAYLQKEQDLSRIEVLFIGQFQDIYKQMVNSLGLNQIVKYIGYVPHSQSIAHIKNADVLLLFINDLGAEEVLTGKIFEYLATGNYIFGMVPEGEAASLIKKLNVGTIIEPNSISNIVDGLRTIISLWENNEIKPQLESSAIKKFSRKEQTKQLSNILENMLYS